MDAAAIAITAKRQLAIAQGYDERTLVLQYPYVSFPCTFEFDFKILRNKE